MLGISLLFKSRRKKSRGAGDVQRAAIEAVEGRVLLAGNGLAVTYFDTENLTGTMVSRVDATVSFDWGTGSPNSAIAADTFSARWTGQVQVDKAEAYSFYTTSDDGVRLWIDGKQIINNWTEHAPKEDKGVVTLAAGRHDVKLEYFEKLNGAVIKLLWSSPSTAKQVIPQSQLYSSAVTTPAGPVVGNGNGLLGTYFDNQDFTGKSIQRTDTTVNFDWGSGGPATGIAADTFSVRWTGQVQAQRTEEYSFYTQSDDGVRVWVNGVKLIDNWSQHAPVENSGKIKLEAGKKYDIKVEYFEASLGAVMQLKWSSATTAKQAVPKSQLFSTAPVNTSPSPAPTPTPTPAPVPAPVPVPSTSVEHGLLGTYYDNVDFSGNSIARYDDSVQFDWGTSSPHEVIGRDTWAARWQGQVVAGRSEDVTFHVTSDGGARLWVDGKVVIDDWAEHAKREWSGKIYLTAGRHDIRLDYFKTSGSAVAQLRWSSASIAKQFIPTGSLFAAKPPPPPVSLPTAAAFTGYKTYTSSQVNFRPGGAADKSLTVDGYRISKIPIDTKGLNIAVTDLVPGQKAFAYRNITIKNTEISDVYRTPGYHNDFIRIAGAAGRQDVPINITFENIKIHTGQAIPILITDGDYDTIIIRNVQITDCTVNQLQINTQNVGSVKHIIVENCPGLSVAIVGRTGTIGDCVVYNSPGARVSDSLNQQGTKSGVRMTILP